MKIKTLLLGAAMLAFQTNRAQLLHADFNETETVSDYVSANPFNRLFNAIGSTGTGVQVSINQGHLHFNRTGSNTGSFSRTTNFSGIPDALALRIQLKVSDNLAAQTSAAVFQIGAGFSTNNSAEINANVHSRIGINLSANAGDFSIRDLGSSSNSTVLTGPQTLLWVINNTGTNLIYAAPNGLQDTLTNDTWDLWAGNTKLFNDRLALTPSQSLEDFKFVFSNGTGKISIDQIMIDVPMSLNHFRSAVPYGNYLMNQHWEHSLDSITWAPAACLPSGLSASIRIQTGHIFEFAGSTTPKFCTLNNLFIDSLATLQIGKPKDSLGTNHLHVLYLIKSGSWANGTNKGQFNIQPNAQFQCKGTFQNQGSFKVVSDSIGTGIIGNCRGGTILGVVSVERYIKSIGRRNRNLSTPISNNTVQDWQGEIFITGNGTGNIVGTFNSNGFDATLTNNPSVFWYDETDTGNINLGWKPITHIQQSLIPGRGYRVMVRGDRSDLGRINGTNPTQNAVTLVSTGTLNQGDFQFPTTNITWSGSGMNDGWCLIGNPYAGNIHWNAPSGWQRNNVDAGAIAIWNPQTNSYAYSLSMAGGANPTGASINGGSPVIASHQAFFVRTTGSNPSLSCNENVKTSANATPLFKNEQHPLIKLSLNKDLLNQDEAMIWFNPNNTESETDVADVAKLRNPLVNLGSGQNPKRWLALNALPLYTESKFEIPLYAEIVEADSGVLHLNIQKREAFDELILIDVLTHKQFIIHSQFEQKFGFRALPNPQPRFVLKGKHQLASGLKSNELANSTAYPSPTQDEVFIVHPKLEPILSDITIFNLQGIVVKQTQQAAMEQTLKINLQELPSGIYLIQIQQNQIQFSHRIIKL